METKWSYPSEQDLPKSDELEFPAEGDYGASEEELTYPKRTMAEILVQNPAFKSEKAERALNKLKDALTKAEHDLPEELKNELRHEHKDTQVVQDPVHISTVLADAPSRQPGLASMISDPSAEGSAVETPEDEPDPKPTGLLYRQAIIGGFAAAAILLIIFAALLILRWFFRRP